MNIAARNLAWADRFVAALVAAGLRELVLAPGARSAPLALAALRRPELRCHIINDERAAGFFALGLGKANGRPAAVLCTSGTATANLLPAIMEAHLAGVPLLALTADRPPEALGWGANQSVDQTKLYGDQVRAFHALPLPDDAVPESYLDALAVRLLEECRAPVPGPVHANLPFREPLLPDEIPAPPPLPLVPQMPSPSVSMPDCAGLAAELAGQRGIIVCGELAQGTEHAAALAALAAAWDVPVLAEPLSGLRHGTHDRRRILAHAAHFLRTPTLSAPDWVLRFGSFPVSRTLQRWLDGLTATRQILVAPPGRWPDPLWRCDTVLRGDAASVAAALALHAQPAPAGWCEQWRNADTQAARQLAARTTTDHLSEGGVARALVDALPAGTTLFVGNSLAIRAFDVYSGTSAKPLAVCGNRGASGIDGNLATAAGLGADNQSPLALLVGDQTLLHDSGSLALLARRAAPTLVVVLDNGGGGIFEHLPFAPQLPPELLTRGWTAPPAVDFAALAGAFDLRYASVAHPAALQSALAAASAGGNWLIRAAIDPATSRRQFAAAE